MKTQTTYNKVVNIAEDGEITVLCDVFTYSYGMTGALGHTFYPVSKKEYEEKISDENMIEYLMDSGIQLTAEQARYGWEGVVSGMTTDEREELMFDNSYSELWDEMREAAGLDEESAHIFECTAGGRIFDKEYQGNVNPELSAIIREYENK